MIGLSYLLPRPIRTSIPPSICCNLFHGAVRASLITLFGWERGMKTLPKVRRKHRAPPGQGQEDDEKQRQFSRRSASNFDTLGSWNYRMDLELNLEQSIKGGTLVPEVRLDKVGVATLLGRRKLNEDRYYVGRLRDDLVMFAIFDGHGGAEAAEFVQEHMPKKILHLLEQEDDKDLPRTLRQAFIEVNDDFCRYITYRSLGESIMSVAGMQCILHKTVHFWSDDVLCCM